VRQLCLNLGAGEGGGEGRIELFGRHGGEVGGGDPLDPESFYQQVAQVSKGRGNKFCMRASSQSQQVLAKPETQPIGDVCSRAATGGEAVAGLFRQQRLCT
jgi:hypothetical protein